MGLDVFQQSFFCPQFIPAESTVLTANLGNLNKTTSSQDVVMMQSHAAGVTVIICGPGDRRSRGAFEYYQIHIKIIIDENMVDAIDLIANMQKLFYKGSKREFFPMQ